MHTHLLAMDEDVVRKRFVSWDRGEAEREWSGLVTLARHAPGLGPEPIAQDHEGDAPVVVMSRVPGAPLGSLPLTPAQVTAFTKALNRLFSCPVDADAQERAFGPTVMRSVVRDRASERYDLGPCLDPDLVASALHLARSWLAPDLPERDRIATPVWSVGDGNLANVIWDGSTCRLIDFEEFGVSDLAYEVADVVEHASSRLPRHLDVDALVDALGLDAHQRARLADFRPLLAAFWLVMLLPGNSGFPRNPPGSTEDQARHVIALLTGRAPAPGKD